MTHLPLFHDAPAEAALSAPPPVLVLGTGTGEAPAFAPDVARLLDEAEVVAAPRRLLARFPGKRHIALACPLEPALRELEAARQEGRRCVVLADGDPLLYGIGTTLGKRAAFAAPGSLRILPGVSAMQTACARLRLPWHDLAVLSLHGRNDWLPLAHAALTRRPLCVYTDAANSPAAIARFLLERGADWFRMAVASRLNTTEESVREYDLPEAAEQNFPGGESVILLPRRDDGVAPGPRFGLDERALTLDKGLYTKAPIRAAALSLLAPRPDDTLWDLGAGSGCLSLEAAALLPRGRVVALEREESRVSLIWENRRRIGIPHLDIVHGSAPDALDGLPDPDAVFIGGGLGGARNPNGRILPEAVAARLKPGGRMVAAAALLSTLNTLLDFARERGLRHSVMQIQAAESAPLAGSLTLKPLNPVFLIGIFPGDAPDRRLP